MSLDRQVSGTAEAAGCRSAPVDHPAGEPVGELAGGPVLQAGAGQACGIRCWSAPGRASRPCVGHRAGPAPLAGRPAGPADRSLVGAARSRAQKRRPDRPHRRCGVWLHTEARAAFESVGSAERAEPVASVGPGLSALPGPVIPPLLSEPARPTRLTRPEPWDGRRSGRGVPRRAPSPEWPRPSPAHGTRTGEMGSTGRRPGLLGHCSAAVAVAVGRVPRSHGR